MVVEPGLFAKPAVVDHFFAELAAALELPAKLAAVLFAKLVTGLERFAKLAAVRFTKEAAVFTFLARLSIRRV